MIYTFTPNPSLDLIIEVPRFTPGNLVRGKRQWVVAGGKGLNVAKMLKELGLDVKTFAVLAGVPGEDWIQQVRASGIEAEAIWLDEGNTRVNVKLVGIEQTEINSPGPSLSPENQLQIKELLKQPQDGDILVISGSGTPDMTDHAYGDIIDNLENRDVKVIIDSTAPSVRNAFAKHPYLIKPNIDELKQIANTAIDTENDIVSCAERLIKMGVQNVLVSMGGDGAIWVGNDGFKYKAFAPQGRVKNTVGSGDSMLAAFIYGMQQGLSTVECIHLAVATGSAGAFSENLPTKEEVYDILNRVTGTEI